MQHTCVWTVDNIKRMCVGSTQVVCTFAIWFEAAWCLSVWVFLHSWKMKWNINWAFGGAAAVAGTASDSTPTLHAFWMNSISLLWRRLSVPMAAQHTLARLNIRKWQRWITSDDRTLARCISNTPTPNMCVAVKDVQIKWMKAKVEAHE